jgi:hypothetical protein
MNKEATGRMSTFLRILKIVNGGCQAGSLNGPNRYPIRTTGCRAEHRQNFPTPTTLASGPPLLTMKIDRLLQWVTSNYKSIANAEQLPLYQRLFPSWEKDPNSPPSTSVDAQHIMVSSTPREFKGTVRRKPKWVKIGINP